MLRFKSFQYNLEIYNYDSVLTQRQIAFFELKFSKKAIKGIEQVLLILRLYM